MRLKIRKETRIGVQINPFDRTSVCADHHCNDCRLSGLLWITSVVWNWGSGYAIGSFRSIFSSFCNLFYYVSSDTVLTRRLKIMDMPILIQMRMVSQNSISVAIWNLIICLCLSIETVNSSYFLSTKPGKTIAFIGSTGSGNLHWYDWSSILMSPRENFGRWWIFATAIWKPFAELDFIPQKTPLYRNHAEIFVMEEDASVKARTNSGIFSQTKDFIDSQWGPIWNPWQKGEQRLQVVKVTCLSARAVIRDLIFCFDDSSLPWF